MEHPNYASAEILFAYCLTTSRVLVNDIGDLTGGNVIESLIFTSSVVLKRVEASRPDIYSSMSKHMLILIQVHAERFRLNFGSTLEFDSFIQRRFKWYWREYMSLKHDNDTRYPSVAAYSLYIEPYVEDRICSSPDVVALLRARLVMLDSLIETSLYKFNTYL